MTIQFWKEIVPNSYTPNSGSKWRAMCKINGETFTEESRSCSSERLARSLVAADIDDDQVEVWIKGARHPDGILSMRYKSFYNDLAPYTYVESAKTPLRRGKYVDIADRLGTDDD